MTTTQRTILGIYAAIIAIWPVRFFVLRWILGKTRYLSPDSPSIDAADAPLVTAIIPAKDEEAVLAGCLASVCAQRYPRLEVVVINDRSADRTGAIAAEFAARDPRVTVLNNEEPPPAGWTGKTAVLDRAKDHARGDWLWFLDADTEHAPPFLGVMMEHARSQRAALVSLLPELRCETFWEQLVQPLGGIVLMQSYPLDRVNDDRSTLAFANGQSILVERAAYDEAGGHAAVRDRFVEDIGLAEKVKGLGRPIRTVMVRGLVTCRMYASLSQQVRGWSRILYDALGRSPWRLGLRLLDPLVFCQSGHVAFLAAIGLLLRGGAGPFAWWLLGMSLLHHAFMYAVFRLIYEASVPGSRYAALFPLGNLVTDYILAKSIRMCWTGRVDWRGTSYAGTSAGRPGRPGARAGIRG
ncbi:4,4'-diaponeurosporenoate glycosyltransferase [Aquisphaera giovannonii]|uniref:4,4'-diaponeurosporenoate glycosyltransferase n=1 Tax=Aquisphaera giovannonii TaxID=406548 RepID=A0A5B9W039_9BACT|nr:glycosyltransferase [Aquisphaera giovannonii]QEH33883.1 4,4'-diaponeurosporenoate glycosyltransferase [Aquisphaera giovannonii]